MSAIQSFLSACRRPAVLDFGDRPIALLPGRHALDVSSGKLVIDAWDDQRSLSRRILSIERSAPGVLDCAVQRFGGAPGRLSFLDLERPQTASRSLRGSRQFFAEQFRRMLCRQFPGWNITTLSAGPDLSRSFSPVFPRASLIRGNRHVAALACPAPEDEPAMLSFALLWFDYLCSHLPDAADVSLCLFLPETAGNLTAQRLRWLTGRPLHTRVFLFNEHGMAGQVDLADLGNLETRLTSHYQTARITPEWDALLTRLAGYEGVGCCPEITGAISIRFRGLEFARFEDSAMLLGIDQKERVAPADFAKIEQFAVHLASLGNHRDPRASGLPAYPERWFESAVRSGLTVLDAELLPVPVHGQVLTFAGGERELIDLLAISRRGQLAIIELKTSDDIQLPIQGLDYWMRVGWHAGRRELDPLFPGMSIATASPKLLLVAPALAFHPSNEIVMRYFSPEIEVQRVGVNSEWWADLKVVTRLEGADVPISHRRENET